MPQGPLAVPPAVDLAAAFASIDEHWSPRVAADLNGQQVRLAKLLGAFSWHAHAEEDEAFLVWSGRLRIELRDREPVELGPGGLAVIPRGVEHRPVADEECCVVLFEPATVVSGGESGDPRSKEPGRMPRVG